MWKSIVLLLCFSAYCCAVPLGGFKRNMPIILREDEPMIMEPGASQESDVEKPAPEPLAPEMHLPATLNLPSNATSIRADITDNFSCGNKAYGYYADVDNDCQIFHVCLPVTYADGKENTFRWSFICPEETIFSQDSFTCMRREDMAIDCEDSVNYYELNQNFGMIDDDKTSNMPTTNEQQATASAMDEQQGEQQHQQEANEPIMQIAVAPAPQQQPKPMIPKEKPAKVPKPNRRKPQPKPQPQFHASINPTHKLPSITPLRKMPQVGPLAPAVVPLEVASVEKEEIKPLTQRYKTRPAASSTIIEEKFQPVKTESTVPVQNTNSYKRKRPTYPYVKDATVTKVDAAPGVEVTQSVSSSVSSAPLPSTVKLEAPVVAVSVPVPAPASEEVEKPIEQAPLEVSNAVKTVAEADAVPQASETAEIVLKPEGVLQTADEQTSTNDQPEPEPAKEPESMSESVAEVEAIPETKEPEAPAEAAAEPTGEEAPKAENPELQQTNEEAAKSPAEAIQTIPAVILETEENKPDESLSSSNIKTVVAIEDKPTEAEEPKPVSVADEAQPIAEEEKPAQNADAPVASGTVDQPEAPAAPAIFEANSEEELPAAPTLEEMEDAKPANAVEIMQATPEMEQHDPVVQQMFEGNNEHMQTVGGFKPVDPALAAEAEALITDFLMTLKSDTSHSRPILPIEMAEEIPAASVETEDIQNVSNEEAEKTETEITNIASEPEAPKEPETDATVPKTAIAEEAQPEPEAAEPQPMENGAPLPNVLMMNSFPGDMYQIPVKVIQTPIEMAQQAEDAKTETEATEAGEPSKQTEPERVAYRPISIDDIVELVKERLDQVPANEKGTPMQLVMEPVENGPTTAEHKLDQMNPVAPESGAQPESAEDIIFPIYHRLSEVNSNLVKSEAQEVNEPSSVEEVPAVVVEQTLPEKAEVVAVTAEEEPTLTAEKSVQTDELELGSNVAKSEIETDPDVTAVVAEAANKANRAYRSRSLAKANMDPRKRRFLFRSDAS